MKIPVIVAIDSATNELTLKVKVKDARIFELGETIANVQAKLFARDWGSPLYYVGLSKEEIADYEARLDEYIAKHGAEL